MNDHVYYGGAGAGGMTDLALKITADAGWIDEPIYLDDLRAGWELIKQRYERSRREVDPRVLLLPQHWDLLKKAGYSDEELEKHYELIQGYSLPYDPSSAYNQQLPPPSPSVRTLMSLAMEAVSKSYERTD
jgi:hypothetical protein